MFVFLHFTKFKLRSVTSLYEVLRNNNTHLLINFHSLEIILTN